MDSIRKKLTGKIKQQEPKPLTMQLTCTSDGVGGYIVFSNGDEKITLFTTDSDTVREIAVDIYDLAIYMDRVRKGSEA